MFPQTTAQFLKTLNTKMKAVHHFFQLYKMKHKTMFCLVKTDYFPQTVHTTIICTSLTEHLYTDNFKSVYMFWLHVRGPRIQHLAQWQHLSSYISSLHFKLTSPWWIWTSHPLCPQAKSPWTDCHLKRPSKWQWQECWTDDERPGVKAEWMKEEEMWKV